MLQVIATGRLGKDAELKSTGRDPLCSFSVACSKKIRGQETTIWLGCAIWGARGEKLVQYLRKGTKVTVIGELSTREHNGKTYLDCRVAELDFASSNQRERTGPDEEPAQRSGFDGGETGGDDDPIPF